MKIELLDIDKLIEVNNLKEVSSPFLFSNKTTFDDDGLLSNEIFGISTGERRRTFAYIDLKRKFIHPHIYGNILKKMFRNIGSLISGQKYFRIKDGVLIEDFENGWTGLDELYKHWNEINWKKNTLENNISRELLTKLKRDDVFISKIVVCPPAYRDIVLSETIDSTEHVSEINNLYRGIIRQCSNLASGGLFASKQYTTQKKLQESLVELMNFFKEQISKKKGLIRRNLMGKSVDYGVRSVISAPTYRHDRMEDALTSIRYTAVPISQCCSLFYPFIESWLKNFFTSYIINNPNIAMFYIREDDGKYTPVTGNIRDPEVQFSDKNIKKYINDYMFNPDNRFRAIELEIEVPQPKGKPVIHKVLLEMKANVIKPDGSSSSIKRMLTITDVLYIAAVDVCEKRHVMVSRYPVGTDKSIFFNRIKVQSTLNHIRVVFNGKEYPNYPDIDLKIPQDRVSTQFIDTLVMSNSHLKGLGAD